MKKSIRVWAILLAVLMAVSAFPVSIFASANVISEVDPDGELVWETIIPYNDASATSTWSTTTDIQMTELDFYSEIPAVVDGTKTMVPVTWTSDNYKYNVPGTYYYTATANGYTFAEGIEAKIAVKVVDGVFNAKDTIAKYLQWGSNSAEGNSFNVVVKGTDVYDATGCNVLTSFASSSQNKFIVTGTSNVYSAGKGTPEGMSSDKVLPASTSGLQSIKVINGVATGVIAGNGMVPHNGDRYVYIDGFTGKYIFGGSLAYGKAITESGNTTLDITGKIAMTTGGGIYSGGFQLNSAAKVNNSVGTATINIFDLDAGSTIIKIARGNNSGALDKRPLELNLDDTSKYLLSDGIIKGVTLAGYTDELTTVKINGEEFVGVIEESTITDIPNVITKGEANKVLPTSFGSLSGFTWEGEDIAGQQTFTLTAPEGYFFDGLVKTKEYTITVNAGVVAVEEVKLDKTEVTIAKGTSTELTATVIPDNATDATVTWSASGNVTLNQTTGSTVKVTGLNVGEGTVTATAGGVSSTCVVTVEESSTVTAVDPDNELVWETKIPYNDITNSRWSSTADIQMTELDFYSEIPVVINGEKQMVAVTE
ncbi:MAG: Ig-like domain-containing protein, partial [Clostridia bacterium]|nr:Ig-like domain-containing protein [Clostridia bacterium]